LLRCFPCLKANTSHHPGIDEVLNYFGQFNDALFRRFEDARLRKILAQAKQEMVAGRALQETDQYGMIF